jgi:hypothetical protein
VKITEQELRAMIREHLEKRLHEATDFSARRAIIHSAEKSSMEFEAEIIGLLGLEKPDTFSPEVQKKYYEVAEEMKDRIVRAVMDATRKLTRFPKQRDDSK